MRPSAAAFRTGGRWLVGVGSPQRTVRRARSWPGSEVSERLPEWLFAAFQSWESRRRKVFKTGAGWAEPPHPS